MVSIQDLLEEHNATNWYELQKILYQGDNHFGQILFAFHELLAVPYEDKEFSTITDPHQRHVIDLNLMSKALIEKKLDRLYEYMEENDLMDVGQNAP